MDDKRCGRCGTPIEIQSAEHMGAWFQHVDDATPADRHCRRSVLHQDNEMMRAKIDALEQQIDGLRSENAMMHDVLGNILKRSKAVGEYEKLNKALYDIEDMADEVLVKVGDGE